MVSQTELIITLWFLVLSQLFRDSMGPFKVIFTFDLEAWIIQNYRIKLA